VIGLVGSTRKTVGEGEVDRGERGCIDHCRRDSKDYEIEGFALKGSVVDLCRRIRIGHAMDFFSLIHGFFA